MPKTRPDHDDADLILKLYELRREAVMRESRNAINAKFLPRSYVDVAAIAAPDHPLNAAWRQVSSYWEMAYGMARHEIVCAEYLAENSGEGMLLFSKLRPYLAQFRQQFSPTAFQNAEWISRNTERGKLLVELFSKRLEQQLAAQK